MKKGKKLNNKGFTLIELLAVIVILAVIMVIASTSVIGSMNSSKRKSLQNSAAGAADAFTTAISEAILNNETDFYGISGLLEGTSTENAVKSLSSLTADAKKQLNLNDNDYDLANSYVVYDGTMITICFSVESKSQFYVAADKSTAAKTVGVGTNAATIATATMWACSDGTHSWT